MTDKMSLLSEAFAGTGAYEHQLLNATRARLRSPDDYIRCQMLVAEPLVRRMRRFLTDPLLRVLEVGCGTGGISLYLATQGFRVAAVDREQYDPEALSTAREYAKKAEIALNVYLADAEALPFPDGRFDAVVCGNVVEHLVNPERALAEIHRVLAPGGLAFVDFPLFRGPYGGHIADSVKIPWFHLLPKSWVEAELRRRRADRELLVFDSLNGITNVRFRRILVKAGLTTLAFRRGHFVTHPGRKLIVSLLKAVRELAPTQAWQALREAASEFSAIELAQFPLLLLAVPLSYLPGLGEYFTAGVRYVLAKPGPPRQARPPLSRP